MKKQRRKIHVRFQTWKLADSFCLTPFELSIASYGVSIYIRTGKRVLHWEWSFEQPKQSNELTYRRLNRQWIGGK